MDGSGIYRALESSEFFRGLDQKDIRKIATLCREETFEPGQAIFRQGDTGDCIYIIAEGQVALEKNRGSGNAQGKCVDWDHRKRQSLRLLVNPLGHIPQFLVLRLVPEADQSRLFQWNRDQGPDAQQTPFSGYAFWSGSASFCVTASRAVYGAMERI